MFARVLLASLLLCVLTAATLLAITGFAGHSLPLSAVFPGALPGCVLRVRPDFVDLRITSNGSASLQIGVPEVVALVGVEFWHQMVAMEVGTAVVTATNGLGMRVGRF